MNNYFKDIIKIVVAATGFSILSNKIKQGRKKNILASLLQKTHAIRFVVDIKIMKATEPIPGVLEQYEAADQIYTEGFAMFMSMNAGECVSTKQFESLLERYQVLSVKTARLFNADERRKLVELLAI